MTTEKRILIAPKDILSIGFECPHCGTTYFIPIQKVDQIVRQCPNCRTMLANDAAVPNSSYSDMKTLNFLIEFLHTTQSRDFGANVRFEIAGELKSESK